MKYSISIPLFTTFLARRFHCVLMAFLFMAMPLMARDRPKFKDLGNPTSYIYHAEFKEVMKALQSLHLVHLDTNTYVAGGNRLEPYIMVSPHYDTNYWVGPVDTYIGMPETGKIGQVRGTFNIKILPSGTNTLVKVENDSFELQTGTHYVLSPHFKKTGKRVKIKSNTYHEYLFLHKLGEVLKEPGMPKMKTR